MSSLYKISSLGVVVKLPCRLEDGHSFQQLADPVYRIPVVRQKGRSCLLPLHFLSTIAVGLQSYIVVGSLQLHIYKEVASRICLTVDAVLWACNIYVSIYCF